VLAARPGQRGDGLADGAGARPLGDGEGFARGSRAGRAVGVAAGDGSGTGSALPDGDEDGASAGGDVADALASGRVVVWPADAGLLPAALPHADRTRAVPPVAASSAIRHARARFWVIRVLLIRPAGMPTR
jgi:hypothetical protein